MNIIKFWGDFLIKYQILPMLLAKYKGGYWMADLIEQNNQVFGNYYDRINNLILKTKQNVVKNINSEMVGLYFEIGSTINELIENYNLEASQNEILKLFSEKLTREFGQGFSVPSLKKMKKFYLTYKGGSALWN